MIEPTISDLVILLTTKRLGLHSLAAGAPSPVDAIGTVEVSHEIPAKINGKPYGMQ